MANDTLPAPATQLAQNTADGTGQRHAAIRLFPAAFWCMLLAACLLRSAGLDRPLLGHYASKSTLYGMIARNWARGLAPAWQPTVDCVVGGQRGLHMVEFPVAAYVAAAGWRLAGGSLDVWGRSVAAACSVAAVALMYSLVRRWHGQQAALAAGWMLALSPVSIIYGQSFMLEASIVAFTLATLAAWDRWLASSASKWLVLAAGCFALLLLTKVYMLVLLIPLVVQAASADSFKRKRSMLFAVLALALAVVPAAAWYGYAWLATLPGHALEPVAFFSLHDAADAHPLPSPLWTSADFYRRLLDDLTGPALTSLGFALALAGLAHPLVRPHLPWLASMGLLVFLLPQKFYRMNYYDLVVLPPLCVLVGLGWHTLRDRVAVSSKAAMLVLAVALLLSLRYAALPAFVTPDEDRGVLPAADVVRQHCAAGEPVVTIHGSGFDLLYYCDRAGWALPIDDPNLAEKLRACRSQGARLLAIANVAALAEHPATGDLVSHLPLLAEGDGFRVYRLAPAITRAAESTAPPQR